MSTNILEVPNTYTLRKLPVVDAYNAIKVLKQIGAVQNNWRKRWVSIHEHPSDPTVVFTIGMPFDAPAAENAVLCVEQREDYLHALERWPKPEIYN